MPIRFKSLSYNPSLKHFRTAQTRSLSTSGWECSGAMLIELRKGMTLHPGTFNVVIAPGKVMVSALNSNTDLQRFLFLYVSGNYSRLLSSISRSSGNFEVRRAFTAHQLFTILKEASHTVVFVEHDPTLFEGAEIMIPQIAGMLKEAGRESLVILYSPTIDRSFSVLMRQADRIIEIAADDDIAGTTRYRSPPASRHDGVPPPAQRTLEVL